MIPWWSTDFGEADIAAVSAAIRAGYISQGPVTREFEERLAETIGVPYVVCTSSGTAALTMALMAAGIGAGDEVIVPDRTWIATAHAVLMTGAKVRLVDVDERGLLCPFQVQSRLGRRRVTMPVNLNGRMATLGLLPLLQASEPIIEDSCQAFPAPPRGLAACYSFSTAKLLPTGQGGAVATRDEGLYRELLAIRTHGVENTTHVTAWTRAGFNFRYTDLQAAIGLTQLATLQERINRLHEIRALYAAGLPPHLEILPCDGVPLYSEILTPNSERLQAHLLAHHIEARHNYPCLHTAPYLHATGHFPNSERFTHGLTLPSGPAQTDANIRLVIEAINAYKPLGRTQS